jgi:hypothetical protein
MTRTNEDFRDRLLRAEQTTPSLKHRYEQELQAMLEKPLAGFRRWVWLIIAVAAVGLAGWLGTLAVSMPQGFPLLGRVAFAVGVLFCLGWAGLGIRVFRCGALNLKVDTKAANGMVWVFTVLLVTIFMVAAPEDLVGLRMIVGGLAFLVMGAVFLIGHLIEQAQLKAREQLLEIEYRLAELTELMKADLASKTTPSA